MPSSVDILAWASRVANQWRDVAMAWHLALASLVVAAAAGWRPSARLLGGLLVSPLVSVSVLAGISGNPFNALTFALLALVLMPAVLRLSPSSVRIAAGSRLVPGAALVAFGFVYPHFVEPRSWSAFAVAAPLGLIPCPTLSAVIGLTMAFDLTGSKLWSRTLAAFGIAYGVIGLLFLGVWIDAFLLAGGVALMTHSRANGG
jgi:hypothetical protein